MQIILVIYTLFIYTTTSLKFSICKDVIILSQK